MSEELQSTIWHWDTLGVPATADYMVAKVIDRKVSYGGVKLRLKGLNEWAYPQNRRVGINDE